MSRDIGNNNGSGFRGLRDYGATSTSSSTNLLGNDEVSFAGFSPTEFMSLSESIAQNIGSVKSSWHALEKAIKIIGGPKDTVATREKVYVEIYGTDKYTDKETNPLKQTFEIFRYIKWFHRFTENI